MDFRGRHDHARSVITRRCDPDSFCPVHFWLPHRRPIFAERLLFGPGTPGRLQASLNVVRKRQADVVLAWRYDRFARPAQALVNALEEFRALGVDFISYQENLDTTTPYGEITNR
ncbi:recombinase family protein [Fodinicurvata sp. EGI_FJ10296]|uniref:recombinase family protein n=1 Tax=Fodinicurvata sp. EGI_FJ10296 TaxID=3231908 RepID=UPI003456E9C5